jgi:hypothetical protein
VFITSVTASNSASIEFTGLPSTYQNYLLTLTNVAPDTDSVQFNMVFSADNGANYLSSDYGWSQSGVAVNGSPLAVVSSGSTLIRVNFSASTLTTTQLFSGRLNFFGFPNASTFPNGTYQATYGTGTAPRTLVGAFSHPTAQTINAIRFSMSSGNIASGTFRLYGIANS